MEHKRTGPSGPAYRPGQPGAQDETPEGVARGAGGAKISPHEPRAAPAGTDAEASGGRPTDAENIVNLEGRRPVGTDPDRTQAGGYEGRDQSRISMVVPLVMIAAIALIAAALIAIIMGQS